MRRSSALTTTALCAGLLLARPSVALAATPGWVLDADGWSYQQQDGSLRTGWLWDGAWYYLDEGGVMLTGWQQLDGKRYHLGANGAMDRGWLREADGWYYLDASGAAHTGWLWQDGWYLCDAQGKMLTGWQQLGGERYFLGDDGAMRTGWLDDGGARFLLDASGAMRTGWQEVDGHRYHFAASGEMSVGWLDDGEARFYLDSEGRLSLGWQELDGAWHYFAADGRMLTGTQTIDGALVRLGEDGAARTGWVEERGVRLRLDDHGRALTGSQQIEGQWYLLDADGVPQTGWVQQGDDWYCMTDEGPARQGWYAYRDAWYLLAEDGKMLTGWQQRDGAWYHLGASGVMDVGWLRDAGSWYYLRASGAAHAGWLQLGSTWYYLPLADDAPPAMVTGWHDVDGATYYFWDSGAMATGTHDIDGQRCSFAASGALVSAAPVPVAPEPPTDEPQANDPYVSEGWLFQNGTFYYLKEDGSFARDSVSSSGLSFALTGQGALKDALVSTLDMGSVTLPAMARMNGTSTEAVAVGGLGAGSLLQFKDLRDPNPEGLTAAQIDDFISTYCIYSETEFFHTTSSLRGQGQAFLDAAQQYGVNALYLVCHAINESAWGCSELACGERWTDPQDGTTGVYYNYFGYAAVDNNPYDGGMRWAKEHGWTSPAAAIAGGAEAISRSWVRNVASPQRTLYEMRWDPAFVARNHEGGWHLYATDDDFCVTVGYLMAWLSARAGVTPYLNLIVPVYMR